jgi:hypothetical protein
MSNTYSKDADAVLDYKWDWSAWLDAAETIQTAAVTAPAGITKDLQSNTTTTVTAWLSGGTVGETYKIGCKIVTNQGRADERSIMITVKDL